jgi:amidase
MKRYRPFVGKSESEELAFAGPTELARRVQAREVTPCELVQLFLGRIESLDGRLNAFRTVWPDEALAAADEAVRSGRGLAGPLAGVPVAVKDDLAVAGKTTTYGSLSRAQPSRADAEVVRRLRAAGAIPIGFTNVPELMIFPWTASDANGITRNPWDPSRTPGGSSGGSAAAVAAGMVPIATGSDGGGSIRIPAACCGLVGMKSSRGRVSTLPRPESWLGLSVAGALARTVADSALLLDVLAGTLPGDRDRLEPPATSFVEAIRRPGRRLRVGVSRDVPPGIWAHLSADQATALSRTADRLANLGHQVIEHTPRYGGAAVVFTQTYLAAIAADHRALDPAGPWERSTRQMAALGRLIPAGRVARLRRARAAVASRLARTWEDIDVLVTPGLARTAIAAEGGYGRSALAAFNLAAGFTPWTAVWNVTGQPAITIPAGFATDGLPTSIQLVGRLGDEATLFAVAAELEAAHPWSTRRPPLAQP